MKYLLILLSITCFCEEIILNQSNEDSIIPYMDEHEDLEAFVELPDKKFKYDSIVTSRYWTKSNIHKKTEITETHWPPSPIMT